MRERGGDPEEGVLSVRITGGSYSMVCFAEPPDLRARNRTTTAALLESIESSRTPPLQVLRNISRSSTVLDPQGLSNTGRDNRNWIQTAGRRSPSRTRRALGTDLRTKSASFRRARPTGCVQRSPPAYSKTPGMRAEA